MSLEAQELLEKEKAVRQELLHVEAEVFRAMGMHSPLNSAHEAYSVILEELEEYKAEVFKKRSLRDRDAMRTELIQTAAMCIRAIVDLKFERVP